MTFILAEDAAIKTLLSGITVQDEKSSPRPVKVWFGYPDVEIRSQTFPFITIELIDISFAADRQQSGYYYDSDYQGTVAPSNTYYGYEVPIAYDLLYQISSYSRHPRHDRALAFQLARKFPAQRGYLQVPNDLGTSTASRHMFMEQFTKLDRAEGEHGNKRLLRNIYTVRVVSEMTVNPKASIPGVANTSINNKGALYPWNLTIPSNYDKV